MIESSQIKDEKMRRHHIAGERIIERIRKRLQDREGCVHSMHYPGGSWELKGCSVRCRFCGKFYGRVK